MELQQEYEFTLPKGYQSDQGVLIRHGSMRLATARDEMEAMSHPKSRTMSEYVTIVLLSKVIVRLGEEEHITPQMIENLYSADVNFLQNMYQTINEEETPYIRVTCPHCHEEFDEPLNFTQEG